MHRLAGSKTRTALLAGVVLLAGGVIGFTPLLAGDKPEIQAAKQLGRAFTTVAKEAVPAVVSIEADREMSAATADGVPWNNPGNMFPDELWQRFFGGRMPMPAPNRSPEPGTPHGKRFFQQGQGSGFLVSPDGLILTNHHVVGEADRIRVVLSDGRKFDAKLIGTDPESDVAVIRIDGSDLPCLPLGDSNSLDIGEWVVAVGNPFGLNETVTSGIVSAKGRSRMGITDYEDYIQTDAAINPGNSGGPLLDLDGKVIGINSAIYSRSGGFQGIGFAIPINLAKAVEKQLVENGKVDRGFLGVVVQDVTPELASSFGLEKAAGVLVSEVSAGGPAEKAGLQNGDVLLRLDDKPITDSAMLRNTVGLMKPGSEVTLAYSRNGHEETLTLRIGHRPDQASESAASGDQQQEESQLGLEVAPLNSQLAERYHYVDLQGVIVSNVDPGSPAANAGIRAGELIMSVDRKSVTTPEEFAKALKEDLADGRVLLRVHDGQAARYVVIKVS